MVHGLVWTPPTLRWSESFPPRNDTKISAVDDPRTAYLQRFDHSRRPCDVLGSRPTRCDIVLAASATRRSAPPSRQMRVKASGWSGSQAWRRRNLGVLPGTFRPRWQE